MDRWAFLVAQYRTWRAVEALKGSLAARQAPRARVREVTRVMTRQWGQRVEQYALRAHLHRMRRERLWNQSMRCFVALTNRANEEAPTAIRPAGAQPRARIQRLDLLLAEAFPLPGPIVPRPPTPAEADAEEAPEGAVEPDRPRRPPSSEPRAASETPEPSRSSTPSGDEGTDPQVFLTAVSAGDERAPAGEEDSGPTAEAVQDGTVEAVREEAASLVAHAAPAAPVDAHSRAPSALVRSRAESRAAGREGTASAEERPMAVGAGLFPAVEPHAPSPRDGGRLPQRLARPRPQPAAGGVASGGVARGSGSGSGSGQDEDEATVPPAWQRRRSQHPALRQQHLQRVRAVLPFLPAQLRDVPAPVLVQTLTEVCEYVMGAGSNHAQGRTEPDPKPAGERGGPRRRSRPPHQPPSPPRPPGSTAPTGPDIPAVSAGAEPRPPWSAVAVDMRSQAAPPLARPGLRGGTVRRKTRVRRLHFHAPPSSGEQSGDSAQGYVPLTPAALQTGEAHRPLADAPAKAGAPAPAQWTSPSTPRAASLTACAASRATEGPAASHQGQSQDGFFLPAANAHGAGATGVGGQLRSGAPSRRHRRQRQPAEARREEGVPAAQPGATSQPSGDGRMRRQIWIPGLSVPPSRQGSGNVEEGDVRQWSPSTSPSVPAPPSVSLHGTKEHAARSATRATPGSDRGGEARGVWRTLPVSARAGARPRSTRFEGRRQGIFEPHSVAK